MAGITVTTTLGDLEVLFKKDKEDELKITGTSSEGIGGSS